MKLLHPRSTDFLVQGKIVGQGPNARERSPAVRTRTVVRRGQWTTKIRSRQLLDIRSCTRILQRWWIKLGEVCVWWGVSTPGARGFPELRVAKSILMSACSTRRSLPSWACGARLSSSTSSSTINRSKCSAVLRASTYPSSQCALHGSWYYMRTPHRPTTCSHARSDGRVCGQVQVTSRWPCMIGAHEQHGKCIT